MPLTDAEIKKAKYTRDDGKSKRLTDGGTSKASVNRTIPAQHCVGRQFVMRYIAGLYVVIPLFEQQIAS